MSLLAEVRNYYSEFRGEGLYMDELATDEYFYVEYYKPIPIDFGFEVEQWDGDISSLLRDHSPWRWHYDGSDPLETSLRKGIYPGRRVGEFVRFVVQHNCMWNWKHELPPEYRSRGCGSHMHVTPRGDIAYIRREWAEAWTTLHNTLVEVVPFILPLFAWGSRNKLYFRREGPYWARPVIRRYAARSVERLYLRPSYYGHPYDIVAWNRKDNSKPLTLELRACETHPSISYFIAIILDRITRKCFERGFVSPKLREDCRRLLIGDVTTRTEGIIYERYRANALERTDLYKDLQDIGPIKFSGGRTIPLLKDSYDRYFDLFDDIIRKYCPTYPPMARVGRLFLKRGYPAANPRSVWYVFEPYGKFEWEDGPPTK